MISLSLCIFNFFGWIPGQNWNLRLLNSRRVHCLLYTIEIARFRWIFLIYMILLVWDAVGRPILCINQFRPAYERCSKVICSLPEPWWWQIATNPGRWAISINRYVSGTVCLIGWSKTLFFLDEIQNFPLWEKWLKGIYDKRKNIKFVISGSNTSLLSEEISSQLTGRHITTRIFPFSFFEFLKYKNISFDLKTIAYSDKKIEIKRIFNEYLVRGGFPEAIMYPAGNQITLLQSYFDDIIYRDIVSRHGVRNPKIFK